MAWKNPPTNFSKTVEKDIDKEMRRITLRLIRELVVRSPVDLGLFVNNWLVGLGSKNPNVLNSTDKSGLSTIARAQAKLKSHKAFEDIWISNNLPYAVRLNNGWSEQAPANFVQSSIRKVLRK